MQTQENRTLSFMEQCQQNIRTMRGEVDDYCVKAFKSIETINAEIRSCEEKIAAIEAMRDRRIAEIQPMIEGQEQAIAAMAKPVKGKAK